LIAYESFFAEVCGALVDAKLVGIDDGENPENNANQNSQVDSELESEIAQGDELSKYISPSKKYVGKSVFGSSNLGNTCFFNSAMQCMNATRPLVEQYIDNRERFTNHGELLKSKHFKFLSQF
jgi:ubiquitin C-terminal hydrolase